VTGSDMEGWAVAYDEEEVFLGQGHVARVDVKAD